MWNGRKYVTTNFIPKKGLRGTCEAFQERGNSVCAQTHKVKFSLRCRQIAGAGKKKKKNPKKPHKTPREELSSKTRLAVETRVYHQIRCSPGQIAEKRAREAEKSAEGGRKGLMSAGKKSTITEKTLK